MSVFAHATEAYAALGVDVEAALTRLEAIAVSIHCWQGDDVGGFEGGRGPLGGGLAVTGCYPGKARTPDELRRDLERALSLIPGRHRLNLHAIYGEFGGKKVERDSILPSHFRSWVEWCKAKGLGFDFNPTCFSHPRASSGFTLAHADKGVRDFWIEHCRRCREIGDWAGQALGTKSVVNVWIPDGYKDTPADRASPRKRLRDSLDRIFEKPLSHALDSVESKLFGIGSEAYVAGSHEFYFGYAVQKQILCCLDSGHYHPTENLADKISSCLEFLPEILLHVSRGVRWDSDHVPTLGDDLLAIAREVVADGREKRIHVGLDYFDASINRVAAWVIGARNLLKALLAALLEPAETLRQHEQAEDFTARLALQEAAKALPWPAVWDEWCRRADVPSDLDWLESVREYERTVLSNRQPT
jgi:L-rhamnose isomerase